MKRYITFTGQTYYASGGARDLAGFYDDIESAKKAALEKCDPERDWPDDWWHVFDTESNEIVAGVGYSQT